MVALFARRQAGKRSAGPGGPTKTQPAPKLKMPHGRITTEPAESPLIASQSPELLPSDSLEAPRVFEVLLRNLGVGTPALAR